MCEGRERTENIENKYNDKDYNDPDRDINL